MPTTFSRREVEAVLAAAATSPPSDQQDLTLDELVQVAREAEIEPEQVQAAIEELGARRHRRLGLAAAALGVVGIAAVLVLGTRATGNPCQVLIHNESRSGFTVELFVPRPGARERSRCAAPPSSRVPADRYCRLARRWLAPGARLDARVPDAPRGCPQVWVRVVGEDGSSSAAIFVLPAGIEIERSGRLDQKGLGSPHMYGTPDPAVSLEACPTPDEGDES
jgi:hypothetical protein